MRITFSSRLRFTLLLAAVSLAGCTSPVSTPLPDLVAAPKPVMSSAEQERAVQEMLARKKAQEGKAIEDFSRSK